jgi:hypothetical protein
MLSSFEPAYWGQMTYTHHILGYYIYKDSFSQWNWVVYKCHLHFLMTDKIHYAT